MSAKASGRVWDLDLPHNKRLVLLAMADHADHDGRNIYPSTDLIAWKTGYSFRQVQRVIDTLIADGILIVVKPARQQHPPTYALDFTAGNVKPPFDRVGRKAQQGRQNGTPQGRQNVIPEKSRDDISAPPGMTFQPPRDDIAVSPKPWEPIMNHDDDDDGRTLAFLIDMGFGAANEFAHLPFDQTKQDYYNRKADNNQSNAMIVKAWRRNPPTKDYHYARPEPPPRNGHPPAERQPPERPAVPANLKRVSSAGWKKSD
jgi:hypothetical protein